MDSNLSERSKTSSVAFSNDPFPIDIRKSKMVGHLQNAIKKEKEPELDHLDANSLILWKVSSSSYSFL